MKKQSKIIDTRSMLSVSILEKENETEILIFSNSSFAPVIFIKANKDNVTTNTVYSNNFSERGNSKNDNKPL